MYKVDYKMGDYTLSDIPEFEGKYAVDTQGTVWNLQYEKPLKPSIHKTTGYCRVNLTKDGYYRTFYVHRLVALAFIPTVLGLDEIDHIDGDKTNNKVNNLQWITHAENCAKNRGKTANCKKIRCIETGKIFNSINEAARFINRSQSGLVSCLKGRSKTSGGYHWEYVNDEVNE